MLMTLPRTITIDGPASSGKSTLGNMLARQLGYLYFDTGVMYRAVTYAAIARGIPIDDEDAITLLAEQCQIEVKPPSKPDGRSYDVLLDGQDVTWEIRRADVDGNVSPVSAYIGVRRALSEKQRRIGMQGNVVMVGRDIGTVILPEADMKFYIDASVEVRARRRYAELKERGVQADFESIRASIQERDRIDSTREVAPLRISQDAIIINTDELDVNQVFEKMLGLLEHGKTNF
jgi:cytidylate kinase